MLHLDAMLPPLGFCDVSTSDGVMFLSLYIVVAGHSEVSFICGTVTVNDCSIRVSITFYTGVHTCIIE